MAGTITPDLREPACREPATAVANTPAKPPHSPDKKVIVKPVPPPVQRSVAAPPAPVLTNHSGSQERR